MWKHLIRSRRFQIRCKLFSFDILKKFLTIMIPSTLQQSFISAGKILSPFYFIVSIKLVSDGVLRGSAAMNRFMTATFIDLTIRVVLVFVLSKTFLGSTGIWLAWPVRWAVSMAISVFFSHGVMHEKMEELETVEVR